MTVFPHSIRRQTSIVSAPAVDHAGTLTLYVANIDFERAEASVDHGAGPVEVQPPVPQAEAAAPSADRPAVVVGGPAGARGSLSTGLLSLGMTMREARRRLTGAYVFSSRAGAGDGPDAGFVAEKPDRSERYEVRSQADTVFLVSHAVRFGRGHQRVLSTLVGRLLAQYETGPTLVTLPGAAAGADVPLVPPQSGWQRDWIGRPVVMAPRDTLQDATDYAGSLAGCAAQMALLDPSDADDRPAGDGPPPVVPASSGPDVPSCGREVLVRIEPGTVPGVAGRLLVILADQPAGR